MKEFAVRFFVVFPIAVFLDYIYGGKGLTIGAGLALLNFYLSRQSLSLILKIPFFSRSFLAVLSFLIRLVLMAVVFYLLALYKYFELVAVFINFIILYTLLLFLEMKLGSFRLGS